jgi:hypothetical protein
MALSQAVRSRLETQGFACDDPAFDRVEPWLRLTPSICTVLMGLGAALALAPLLWALVPIALLGAAFPVHPFDLLYNLGLRRFTGTPPLPHNGAPRRFACGAAAVWLMATASVFGAGLEWAGYTLGGILTAVSLLVSVTHFCIPSTVYQFLFGSRCPAH